MSATYSIASDLSGKLLARIIGARQKTLRNTLSSPIGSTFLIHCVPNIVFLFSLKARFVKVSKRS